MELRDIVQLNHNLQGLYGERYPGMTNAMTLLWFEHLRSYPADIAYQAVERWAVSHLLHHVPTVEDLAKVMDEIAEERRRAASWKPTPVQQLQLDGGLTYEEAVLQQREKELPLQELQALLQPLYRKLGMPDEREPVLLHDDEGRC